MRENRTIIPMFALRGDAIAIRPVIAGRIDIFFKNYFENIMAWGARFELAGPYGQ